MKYVMLVLIALVIVFILYDDFCRFHKRENRVNRTENALRALAAAIVEVDGGNGSIDDLLNANAYTDEELRRKVRAVLDTRKTGK